MRLFLSLISVTILFANIYIFAQEEPKEGQSIDKIAAIVGDEIIMQSDVDGQVYFMSQYDKSIDVNDKAFKLKILETMIDNLLMVNQAKLDSIIVSEDEVNQRMEMHLQSEIQRFGSERRVEQVYGMSIARIKNDIKDKIRQNLLVQQLVQIQFADVKVSKKEFDEFYENNKDSLPMIPASIELFHIVKDVKANTDQKKETYEFAMRVRDSILAGGDFSLFAKEYSADPGTASLGGDLGWFEKGKLFPEYEKAAFSLAINEVSLPIETPFGFHIIQTLDKKSDAVNTRHILFKIGQSDEDVERAKTELSELKQRALDGESFEELAKKYSDDKDSKGFGGLIGRVPLSDISGDIKNIVDSLGEGGISDPISYQSDPTSPAYHIVYIKREIKEHKAGPIDDYKELEMMAIEYKKRKLYAVWLDKLRKELYWEIKE